MIKISKIGKTGKTRARRAFRISVVCAGTAAMPLLLGAALISPDWIAGSFVKWSRAAVHILSLLNSWLPFSVAEFLVYGVIIAIPALIIVTIVKVCRKKWRGRAFLRLAAAMLCTVFCAVVFYEGIWALGYHSRPLADTLGYEVHPYSRDELYAAAEWMLEAVNREAGDESIARDENGVTLDVKFGELADMARESWEALAAKGGYFGSFRPVTVKPVLASELMSYAGITGIFFAFTGEANLNVAAPASSKPYTAAHELAHAAMVCPENEANFAAWLACRESPYALFRYSGALSGFVYLYNSLYNEDRDAAFELYGRLDRRARADLAYRSEYWAAHEGKLEKVSTAVNDTYLRVMAQPQGVKSYGMVSDLLIAEYLRSTGAAY